MFKQCAGSLAQVGDSVKYPRPVTPLVPPAAGAAMVVTLPWWTQYR